MKLVIYFLNFAFSKSFHAETQSKQTRDAANVHQNVNDHFHDDWHGSMHEHYPMPHKIGHIIRKRFEPTGWLSSMMAGAISKCDLLERLGVNFMKSLLE